MLPGKVGVRTLPTDTDTRSGAFMPRLGFEPRRLSVKSRVLSRISLQGEYIQSLPQGVCPFSGRSLGITDNARYSLEQDGSVNRTVLIGIEWNGSQSDSNRLYVL